MQSLKKMVEGTVPESHLFFGEGYRKAHIKLFAGRTLLQTVNEALGSLFGSRRQYGTHIKGPETGSQFRELRMRNN